MLHSSERFFNCFDLCHWNSPTNTEIRQNSSLGYLSVMSAMRSHLCCVKTSKRSHSFSIPVPFIVESISQSKPSQKGGRNLVRSKEKFGSRQRISSLLFKMCSPYEYEKKKNMSNFLCSTSNDQHHQLCCCHDTNINNSGELKATS